MKNSNFQIFIYTISAILIGSSFALWPLYDPDLGWHILGGEYIYKNKLVPSEDFINTFSNFWHDYHWLAQILFYKFYQIKGFFGLGVLQILLGITFSSSLLFLIYSYKPKVSIAVKAISFLIIFYLVFQIASLRPQLISLSILSIIYALLLKKSKSLITLFTTIILCILCVNIHIYWIFIPFLWLILVCFKEKEINAKKRAYFCFILILASGLISPYGLLHQSNTPNYILLNYALIWEYLSMPASLKNNILELQSILKAKPSISLSICVLLFFFGKKVNIHYVKKKPFILFIAFIGLCLALRSTKFLGIFAIFATPLILDCVASHRKIINKYFKLIMPAFFILGVLLCTLSINNLKAKELTLKNELIPFKSCEKLASVDNKVRSQIGHIRVLTHFDHGGWCKFIVNKIAPKKDIKFTTDGRTQWVPPKKFEESFDLFNVKNNWAWTLKDWSPDYAIIWKGSSLSQFLARDYSNWSIIQEDDNFALFKNNKNRN